MTRTPPTLVQRLQIAYCRARGRHRGETNTLVLVDSYGRCYVECQKCPYWARLYSFKEET